MFRDDLIFFYKSLFDRRIPEVFRRLPCFSLNVGHVGFECRGAHSSIPYFFKSTCLYSSLLKPLPVVTSGAVASKPALAVVAFLPSVKSPDGSREDPGWLERITAFLSA